MDNDKLISDLTALIQEKGSRYNNNELFGLLSLVLLIKVSEIFHSGSGNIPALKDNNSTDNLAPLGNLAGLLNQLQGNSKDGNSLQQMLPMLMGMLGGGGGGRNNNPDLTGLINMLNSPKPQENQRAKNTADENNNPEKEENTKKKAL